MNIVVITGAGVSAESGISTYRDNDGLWQAINHEEVASPEAWKKDRKKVLDFWNERKRIIEKCEPNDAHRTLVKLEKYFNVHIITQNVDDLHEKAGSTNVLHLHGEIKKARSSVDRKLIYDIEGKDILIGERCEKNSQLRPYVVWFDEYVPLFPQAQEIAKSADIILVIGCSLEVYPAASLVTRKKDHIPLYVIDPNQKESDEFHIKENATTGVAKVVAKLIETRT